MRGEQLDGDEIPEVTEPPGVLLRLLKVAGEEATDRVGDGGGETLATQVGISSERMPLSSSLDLEGW